MAVIVSLRDIVDAIDSGNGEWQTYLDTETGEIVLVTDDDRSLLEEDDIELESLPEWERLSLEQARLTEETPDRFLPLPDSFEVHEWEMLRRCSLSLDNPEHREELYAAIHGSGAFRFFKATVDRLGLREAWFAYRQRELEDLARDWLTRHGIAFVERTPDEQLGEGPASP